MRLLLFTWDPHCPAQGQALDGCLLASWSYLGPGCSLAKVKDTHCGPDAQVSLGPYMWTFHSLSTAQASPGLESLGMTHQVATVRGRYAHTASFQALGDGCSSTVQMGQAGTGAEEGRSRKWAQDGEASCSVKRSACVG